MKDDDEPGGTRERNTEKLTSKNILRHLIKGSGNGKNSSLLGSGEWREFPIQSRSK